MFEHSVQHDLEIQEWESVKTKAKFLVSADLKKVFL